MSKTNFPEQLKATVISEEKTCGGWRPLRFDRELVHKGVRWLRVEDGLGGRGDHEDWVADLGALTASVHDYQFRDPRFGALRYSNIFEAMDDAFARGVECLKQEAEGLEKKLANIRATLAKATT